jgi:glutaminase
MPTYTGNPVVNAGAIGTGSLISGASPDEKWTKTLNFYSKALGEKRVSHRGCIQTRCGHQRWQQNVVNVAGKV